jgi:hypothetical protein
MMRRAALLVPLILVGALLPGSPAAAGGGPFTPGAPGIGDPYFPLDGNGGYDVAHYDLKVRYTPATDVLAGRATIVARATQNLSAFNLDLHGLTVRSVTVNGRPATFTRSGDELTITPQRGIRKKHPFITMIHYDGVPQVIEDAALGASGVFHTDDGAVVVGQPDVAATWFPVNDHPIDKASFRVAVTVPAGLEAISNGRLVGRRTAGGWSTWTWHAKEPMAPYLATATVGEFDLDRYTENGVRFVDAFDPDLFAPAATPRTGERMAVSGNGGPGYKRLTRVVDVPADGAELTFAVERNTEANWDHFFVEAHTVGADDWTTLPDRNGHTSTATGASCPYWLTLHPFLTHYQTAAGEDGCTATGTTGAWNAAAGSSDGWEQWSVDLSRYAGRQVEVSLTYASDDSVHLPGVFLDDVTVGSATTSFEDGLGGWTVPGAPAGSAPNPDDWISGTVADLPPSTGDIARASLRKGPEILSFLAERFGPYPFRDGGGIVDDTDQVGFALENQTRPIYSKGFFSDQVSGDLVVVHELAHQWYGNSVAVRQWRDIWLNEGFATYAEWLWAEDQGLFTAQQAFDDRYQNIPLDSPFWQLRIGDPGPANIFAGAVYDRGAMTLHQLRLTVGDRTFFRILRGWASSRRGGNVSTPEFVAFAERVSGRELSPLFDAWLFTAGRPALTTDAAARTAAAAGPVKLGPHVRR